MTSHLDSTVPNACGTGGICALTRCFLLAASGIGIDDNAACGRAAARGDGA